jgi:hypothetical protein
MIKPGMVLGLTSKPQEVIAVAADEDQSLRTRVAKDFFIGCVTGNTVRKDQDAIGCAAARAFSSIVL